MAICRVEFELRLLGFAGKLDFGGKALVFEIQSEVRRGDALQRDVFGLAGFGLAGVAEDR